MRKRDILLIIIACIAIACLMWCVGPSCEHEDAVFFIHGSVAECHQ